MSWNLLVNQDIHFFPLPGHTKGAIMACPSSVVLVVQELRHQLYLVQRYSLCGKPYVSLKFRSVHRKAGNPEKEARVRHF